MKESRMTGSWMRESRMRRMENGCRGIDYTDVNGFKRIWIQEVMNCGF